MLWTLEASHAERNQDKIYPDRTLGIRIKLFKAIKTVFGSFFHTFSVIFEILKPGFSKRNL